MVSVKKSGKHVTNSPFKIMVGQSEIGDASKVKVSGKGLVEGRTFEVAEFIVDTRTAGEERWGHSWLERGSTCGHAGRWGPTHKSSWCPTRDAISHAKGFLEMYLTAVEMVITHTVIAHTDSFYPPCPFQSDFIDIGTFSAAK